MLCAALQGEVKCTDPHPPVLKSNYNLLQFKNTIHFRVLPYTLSHCPLPCSPIQQEHFHLVGDYDAHFTDEFLEPAYFAQVAGLFWQSVTEDHSGPLGPLPYSRLLFMLLSLESPD